MAYESDHQELAKVFRALTAEMGIAGKLTQLGALASYAIPGIHADLAVLANHLQYGSGTPEAKIEEAIQKVKAVVAEMDKLNIYLPKPTAADPAASETE